MITFLLDTNACLDFALARSDVLRHRVREHYGSGLAISAITLGELRVGARREDATAEDARLLDMLIRLLDVLPFEEKAAEEYGKVAREVGVRRGSFDRLIAAHARSMGLILVTNNTRDFADIPGLRVEDWTR